MSLLKGEVYLVYCINSVHVFTVLVLRGGREIVTGRESSLLKPVLVNLQKSLMEQVKAEN